MSPFGHLNGNRRFSTRNDPSIGPILGKFDIEIRFDVINIFFNIEVWILFWSDRSLSGDFGASKVFELPWY